MRDICRNFQRGSCQYGDRCKFMHVVQQQRKPNNAFGGQGGGGSYQQQNANPFGFGSQTGSQPHQQQQKSNPFGFGTQNNNSQLKGGPHNDFKQGQFKPFENKWSRSTPQNGPSRQSEKNTQQASHECTDPETCKRQIAEDFKQEKPLWILTCYGHSKGAPCDIVGDISYEELRAAAYEDAKRGMNMQSIVEKERNILKSKLVEFEKLLSEPYKMPLNSSLDSRKHQPVGANANPFSMTTQNNGPLSVSSFSQLGASLNTGFGRPSAPLTNTQTQSSFFGSGGNTLASNTPAQSNIFGSGGNTLATNTPAQSNFFGSGGNTLASNTPAQSNFFGSGGNTLASNTANLRGGGFSVAQSSPFPTPVELTMFPSSTSQQSSIASSGPNSTTMFQTVSDVQLSKSQQENASGDLSIWLKEKWNPGEIPEEAPPDTVVR